MHLPLLHTFTVLALAGYVHCDTVTFTGPTSKFIGYYIQSTTIEALYANSSWITYSNTWAGDCASSPCVVPTACVTGNLTYAGGAYYHCPGPFTCATMTIYQGYPNQGPAAVNYGCRYGWSASTVYRELEAVTTGGIVSVINTATPAASSMTSGPSMTSTASITSAPAAVTVTVQSNPSSDAQKPSSSPSPSSSSKAWIAGVVIGALLVIGLIVAALFFLRRKKQVAKPTEENTLPPYELGNNAAGGHSATKYAYEKPGDTQHPTEMPTPYAEMPSYHEVPQELYGDQAHR